MDTRRYFPTKPISHPRFANFYNRMMRRASIQQEFEPLRREIVGQAYGLVLEVGAGGGQNFSFYDPTRVTSVEAVEPDATMLGYAQKSHVDAPVPITLTPAPAELLPFPAAHFDSVVATLVFCSVHDPMRSLQEIHRVLKPTGSLLLLEHVRAQGKIAALIQGALVPVTTRLLGNCHWNRNTQQTAQESGFQITQMRQVSGGLHPMFLLQMTKVDR
jgi:ubiquinone/menaquinone biosynthesis C-methylase UbiE